MVTYGICFVIARRIDYDNQNVNVFETIPPPSSKSADQPIRHVQVKQFNPLIEKNYAWNDYLDFPSSLQFFPSRTESYK
jgi:hypothetical protein